MLNRDGSEHVPRPGECDGSYEAAYVTANDAGRRRVCCRRCGRTLRPMAVRKDGRGWQIATVPFHKLPSAMGGGTISEGTRP